MATEPVSPDSLITVYEIVLTSEGYGTYVDHYVNTSYVDTLLKMNEWENDPINNGYFLTFYEWQNGERRESSVLSRRIGR